jgi:serine/threonine-protein kinase
MIGKTVGKYRVIDRLGRGGMGTVYKAVDETLDREVAIKVLNPELGDSDVLKRFRAEAVTLARLNHPGIATLYELHRQDDDLLMVMEFVRGETFHDLSERIGPIAPPQAAHLCMQVLDALAHAHRAGVIHRDLKPANLMVTDTGTVKVMDFGIARVLGAEHFTYGGYMMGTPAFMAPEQVLGREVDGRSDLYAVGVVLYRLLSAHLPFDGDTAVAIIQKQVSEAPRPIAQFRPDLPPWCTGIIERALQKAPSARFQSAEQFRAALQSAVQPQTLGELPTLLTPTPPGMSLPWETKAALEATHAVTTSAARSSSASAAVATPPVLPITAMTPLEMGQDTEAAARPAAPQKEHKTTTLVLGRTHLFALAALLIVILAGMGALAIAVFKRGSLQEQVPFLGTDPQAAAPKDPAAAHTPPPAGPESAPPATPAPVAATAGAGTATPAASSVPPPSASKPSPPATVPTAGSVDPAAAKAARARGPAAPPPAVKTAAAPPILFNDVRVLVTDPGNKGRERQAVLQLADGRVSLVDRDGGGAIASLAYAEVQGAFYSRSKQPKWRDANGKEVESKVDLGRMGFFRGDRNWLILLNAGEPLIIRLEDSNLQKILPAVQERTGVEIKR